MVQSGDSRDVFVSASARCREHRAVRPTRRHNFEHVHA
jgi:hypothetical protein